LFASRSPAESSPTAATPLLTVSVFLSWMLSPSLTMTPLMGTLLKSAFFQVDTGFVGRQHEQHQIRLLLPVLRQVEVARGSGQSSMSNSLDDQVREPVAGSLCKTLTEIVFEIARLTASNPAVTVGMSHRPP
jgi:hypothetical protein